MACANQSWEPMEDIVLLNNLHEGVSVYKDYKNLNFAV